MQVPISWADNPTDLNHDRTPRRLGMASLPASETSLPASENGEWLADETPKPNPMLKMIHDRLATNPNHSDTWRMLGRIEQGGGNIDAAIEATSQALKLDPQNAAAHYDYSQWMLQSGNVERANIHVQQVFEIAPNSKYASQLNTAGFEPNRKMTSHASPSGYAHQFALPNAATDPEVSPAGYRIKTFDGDDDLDRRLQQLRSDASPQPKRLRLAIESGLLYNSNVSLTPISRELADEGIASFQGFLSPEVEWIAIDRSSWRMGPLHRGYFTINESQASAFDLASFQPGAFLERDFTFGSSEIISRLDYVYSLDLLDGQRLADRHALTASLITIRPDLDVIYTYVTTSFSDFDDDGVTPAVSSLDGTTFSAGVSRFFQTDWVSIPNFSLGADIEHAGTDGADYRYTSLRIHTDATWKVYEQLSFIPELGIGGRSYPDFTGAIDRDEFTWRVGGRLRWKPTEQTAISLVVGHDRFASDNEDFDTERTEGGIVITFNY